MTHFQDTNRLGLHDGTPHGLYFAVEQDEGAAMNTTDSPGIPPDYFGVRDVARGYTYVEYETGERELYDLTADPWQLDNRAGDAAFATIEAELARRLEQLLAPPRATHAVPGAAAETPSAGDARLGDDSPRRQARGR
jgi:hypothetical protein